MFPTIPKTRSASFSAVEDNLTRQNQPQTNNQNPPVQQQPEHPHAHMLRRTTTHPDLRGIAALRENMNIDGPSAKLAAINQLAAELEKTELFRGITYAIHQGQPYSTNNPKTYPIDNSKDTFNALLTSLKLTRQSKNELGIG